MSRVNNTKYIMTFKIGVISIYDILENVDRRFLIYSLNTLKLDVFSCEPVIACLSCLQLRRQVKLALGLAEKRASQTLKSESEFFLHAFCARF